MSITPYNLFLELNKKVPAIMRRYDADAVGDTLIKVTNAHKDKSIPELIKLVIKELNKLVDDKITETNESDTEKRVLSKLLKVFNSVSSPEQLKSATKYHDLVLTKLGAKSLREFYSERGVIGDLALEISTVISNKEKEYTPVDEGKRYSTGRGSRQSYRKVTSKVDKTLDEDLGSSDWTAALKDFERDLSHVKDADDIADSAYSVATSFNEPRKYSDDPWTSFTPKRLLDMALKREIVPKELISTVQGILSGKIQVRIAHELDEEALIKRLSQESSVIKGLVSEDKCPECGGPLVSEEMLHEKKDACYYKVKSRYKVWPSAYASGALVKCRKKGAKNWGKSTNESFQVSDFAMNSFKSMSEYRRWMQSPKASSRGMTRYNVDQYANIFINDSQLLESNEKFAKRKQEGKEFSSKFKELDQRDRVSIKVGNKIAVLSVVIVPSDKVSRIELSGFIVPKQIKQINKDSSDSIDSIEFVDGSIFPEAAEFTTVGGTNITDTIFFLDKRASSEAYTKIWMWSNILAGKGWKIEEYMNESVKENKGLPMPGTHEQEYNMFKSKGPERIIAMTNEDDAKKTFVVVYYSKKTDRNVTKQVQANNESEVRDALKSKGIQVVSVEEKSVAEGKKRKKKKTSRSSGGYFFPGYGYYGSGESGESGGGDGGGGESVNRGMAEGKECPPATQDITLNLKNRQKAINEYGYGPLNPDMPNTKFWMKKVDEWNLDGVEEAQNSLCGNCAAFDQRQYTLDCIAQGIDSDNPKDAEGVINAGELGYCKFLKFKCASRRTCDAWVTGGPLTDAVRGVAEGSLNEFAQGNGGDDSNDLQLYLNVAKKLNMKKYKPSTAHNLIAKKMAELVDVVDDDKVDYARHMARKEQGLPNMLEQGVAEGSLNEFAPGSSNGGGDDDSLFNYAKMWYNGDLKTQQQVEKALQKSGLDIGENEDENGGAYISDMSGDYYESWTAEDLEQGVAEGSKKVKSPVQQFFVESLNSDAAVIEYVNTSLIPEMRKYNVPVSPENHFTRISSAIFEGVSSVIDSGKDFLETFKRLDQRKKMKIAVGQEVSILNLRMSSDFAELFGFKTPKQITKIYREPTDNKIVQLEFNNDPEDVWPRKPLASFNGKLIITSAFFPNATEMEKSLTALKLATPENIKVRTNISEGEVVPFGIPNTEELKNLASEWHNYTNLEDGPEQERIENELSKKGYSIEYDDDGTIIELIHNRTGRKILVPADDALNENLHKWFQEKWVRFGPDGKIRGDCARGSDSEGKPKCLPQKKAQSLGKEGRASAAARKRRQDPNPERSGKAKNVATKKKK